MSHCQTLMDFRSKELQDQRRESEDARRRNTELARQRPGVAQSWFDPSKHTEIVGCDFGGGEMFVYMLRSGRAIKDIPLRDAAKVLSSLGNGAAAFAEQAHLGTPQRGKSLSQPFTMEQLLDIYRGCRDSGVSLFLTAHQHTRKIRDWSAIHSGGLVDRGKSCDLNDAKGLAYYYEHKNAMSVRKPLEEFGFSKSCTYGKLVRAHSNFVLNAASVHGYGGQVFESVSRLATDIQCGLDRIKEHRPEKTRFVNRKVAFSLASLIVTEIDGAPARFVCDGSPLGWRSFKQSVLRFSPFHYKGGRARSNICWHAFRPYFANIAKRRGVSVKQGASYVPHCEFDEPQEAARREAWLRIRRQMRDAYFVALEACQQLDVYDVITEDAEVSIGR